MGHFFVRTSKTEKSQKSWLKSNSDCIIISWTDNFGWWVSQSGSKLMNLIQILGIPHFNGTVLACSDDCIRHGIVTRANNFSLMATHQDSKWIVIKLKHRQSAFSAQNTNFIFIYIYVATSNFLVNGHFTNDFTKVGIPYFETSVLTSSEIIAISAYQSLDFAFLVINLNYFVDLSWVEAYKKQTAVICRHKQMFNFFVFVEQNCWIVKSFVSS